MTGSQKKMNYPKLYQIRISENLKSKLKKIGTRKVREYLERIR